jgi:putative ABC transport system permease protein
MIRNYLKLAWRTLLKNKTYSLIIISGLALGYAACIMIYLHVSDELSYDRYHQDSDRIYRVVKDFMNDDGSVLPDATTPPALAYVIKQEIPEVEEATKLIPGWGSKFLVRNGDKVFYEEGRFRADSGILKVFTFEFLEGDAVSALSKPNNVIITQTLATKYFGEESPIGKNLEVGDGDDRLKVVTAVVKELPKNSHFHFDLLLALPLQATKWNTNWRWYNWYTYIKLKPGASIAEVEQKIITLFKKHNPESKTRYYTQALTDIHLHSKLKWEMEPSGDATTVNIFITIGIFIILIASINYINLSITQAFNRSKEVGIRKVSGAYARGLVNQFLTESILTSLIAVIFAIALVEAMLPLVNLQFGKNILPLSEQPLEILTGIILGAATLGIISGIYPSIYLSAFRPVQVLKGVFQPGNNNVWLRKGLVVLQFTISVALITGTIIVVRQTNYLKTKDLGFNKEKVLVVENVGNVNDKQALKNAMLQVQQVESVGASNGVLGGQNWTTGMVAKGSTNAAMVNFTMVDYDYVPVMGLQIKSGRNFSRAFPSDTLDRVILNETTVLDLGLTGDPVGTLITDDPNAKEVKWYTIVGVVKDFHFANLRNEIKPYMFVLQERSIDNLAVKINTSDVTGTLTGLKKAWASVVPDRPFEYFFLDDTFESLYKAEENFKLVFSVLAGMAIYIACSGLFAIAAFFIKRRTKEIGIRKVMGASVQQITWLVSAEFLFIVVLANLIAWPLAWYFMDGWLNGFAYRINMSWTNFGIAGLIGLLIAGLTISFQSIKSALANPVDSLRNE